MRFLNLLDHSFHFFLMTCLICSLFCGHFYIFHLLKHPKHYLLPCSQPDNTALTDNPSICRCQTRYLPTFALIISSFTQLRPFYTFNDDSFSGLELCIQSTYCLFRDAQFTLAFCFVCIHPLFLKRIPSPHF